MQARHYSQLYRQLRDLDPSDYQRVIRTYEERETEIGGLDTLEYFELTVYYTDALFATGAYRQHLLMIDPVIEACMRENIDRAEGIEGDVFQHLLFRKAASCFRLRRFDGAIHVAKELIRIAPKNALYPRFLRHALYHNARGLRQFGRAAFVSCILLAALAITINLLVMTSFFPTYVDRMHALVAIAFGLGISCLIGSYGYAFFRADRQAYRFQEAQANK